MGESENVPQEEGQVAGSPEELAETPQPESGAPEPQTLEPESPEPAVAESPEPTETQPAEVEPPPEPPAEVPVPEAESPSEPLAEVPAEVAPEAPAIEAQPPEPKAPAYRPSFDNGILVRLRPVGPWRFGADSGDRERLGNIYHSDSLYSAITQAMARLGKLDEWLQDTALANGRPVVRFTSLFPWQGDALFVTPPRSAWPPPSGKVRTKGASFVPLSLVGALLAGSTFEEDRWTVDGESRCLLYTPPKSQPTGPFRQATRSFAAVDRLDQGRVAFHRASCIEFSSGSGLWCFAAFADDEAKAKWSTVLEGAFRLLADSGFGGRRSIGWGGAVVEEVRACALQSLVKMPAPSGQPVQDETAPPVAAPETSAYWLLSVFSPSEQDQVDWRQGSYSLATRGGRVDSPQISGSPKKLLRVVEEGSVVFAGSPPNGRAADVAPDGSPHPVFRYGYAVTIPLPERVVP